MARHGAVRVENGALILTPLEAEERSVTGDFLEEVILDRLPEIIQPEFLRRSSYSEHETPLAPCIFNFKLERAL